ncbi:copper resistance protein NlpE [Flavobacterium sp. UW10123]|uniref:copper resistance protein NlpE n=1 Tax=Flavobacterium sp. UW10123 TaxID=3230800 RepID=UPI003393E3E4
MKKLLILAIAILIHLTSCNFKKQQDTNKAIESDSTEISTEKDEVDSTMVYEGTLPCADCSGILTVLKINQIDNKFELSNIYQGKSPEKQFKEKGNFNTERGLENDINGTIFILNWDKPEKDQCYYGHYSKNPEKLYLLDRNKKIIKSKLNYFLELNE